MEYCICWVSDLLVSREGHAYIILSEQSANFVSDSFYIRYYEVWHSVIFWNLVFLPH